MTDEFIPNSSERVEYLSISRAGSALVIFPQGTERVVYSPPPSTAGEGVDVFGGRGSSVGVVGVLTQEVPSQWVAYYRVNSSEDGYNYGLKFGDDLSGFDVSVTHGGSPAETIASLRDALNLTVAFTNLGGVASVVDGLTNTLKIKLDAHTIVSSSAGSLTGSPRAACAVEASYAVWRPWALLKHSPLWVPLSSKPIVSTVYSKPVELDLSSVERVYVQVIRSDGYVLPFVGRSGDEGAVEQVAEGATLDLKSALYHLARIEDGNPVGSNGEAPFDTNVLTITRAGKRALLADPNRTYVLLRNHGDETAYANFSHKGAKGPVEGAAIEVRSGEVYQRSGDECPKGALYLKTTDDGDEVTTTMYIEDGYL